MIVRCPNGRPLPTTGTAEVGKRGWDITQRNMGRLVGNYPCWVEASGVAGVPQCAWDGAQAIDSTAIGTQFDSDPRWILESVEDLGTSRYFVDPRADLRLLVIDGVVISMTCRRTFRVGRVGDNLVGQSLVEFESAVGHEFVPDPLAPLVLFECPELKMSCVAMDGTVMSVSVSDFDLVADGPDPPRQSGVG